MEKDNRTIIKKIRFNEREWKIVMSKSNDYSSFSSMIRDAVSVFDDASTIKKIEALNSLSSLLQDHQTELSRIGNNINQLTHYANELAKIDNYSLQFCVDDLLPILQLLLTEIGIIKKNEKAIFKKLVTL